MADNSGDAHGLKRQPGSITAYGAAENVEKEPRSFEFIKTAGATKTNIKFHIARCVPEDISRAECGKIAINACNIACLSIDVLRGRLSPKLLTRLMSPEIIEKMLITEAFAQKYSDPGHFDAIDSAETRHMPVIARFVYVMATSPVTCEATILLGIGPNLCWCNLVISKQRGKWICTMCDVG